LDLRNFPAAVWRFTANSAYVSASRPRTRRAPLWRAPCRNEAGERDQRQMEDAVPLRTKNRER